MFEGIRNWFEVRAAMKDARRLRAGQAILNSVIVVDKLKHAQEMLYTGQIEYATATLDETLARYPDEAAELPETITLLIDLKRLDQAEALAVRGTQRNPDHRDFARLYCGVADYRSDTAERVRRWQAFRRRYPAYGLAFRMEAQALLAAGEDAAAEELLAEGAPIAPDDLHLAVEYARLADQRRDWPEAIRRWTIVRDTFELPVGATRIGTALVEQGLLDQAQAELEAARSRFPLESGVIEDLATLAERRGDLDGALALWADVRRSFTNVARGYTEAARILRDRGEATAADAQIAEAATRMLGDRDIQYEYAAIAERSGDWAEAARRWLTASQRLPDQATPYGREAAALRRQGLLDAAEQVLVAAIERFPTAADLHQEFAEVAEARGDLRLGAERRRAVVMAEPGIWWTHTQLAEALERSGARAEADAALAAAIETLPDEPLLYAEYAALAARSEPDIAATRWAAARRRFGATPALARKEADWLRSEGRLAEAKAVLSEASGQAPDNIDLLHDLGHLAAQEGDWPAAERHRRAVVTQQPLIGWAYSQLAEALRQQGRTGEADAVLAAACEALPRDFGLAGDWARLPADAKDWPEARRRWALLRDRFPAEGHPMWQEGIALREMGLLEEARTLFLAGADRFPTDASFPHDLARLAEARQDQPEAQRWWRRYVALQP